MLENYDKQIIKPIKVGDFGSMEEFIEKRVKELNPTQMTYQLATNLRLYYEPKKRRKAYSIIYSFLSAIIHRTAYESICEEIKEKGSNESEILRVISNEFNLKKVYYLWILYILRILILIILMMWRKLYFLEKRAKAGVRNAFVMS